MNASNELLDYFRNNLKIISTAIPHLKNAQFCDFFIDEMHLSLFFSNEVLYSKFSGAFDHLREKLTSKHKLEVYIIDEETISEDLLSPPWVVNEKIATNDIWLSDDGDIKILHQPEKKSLIMLNLLNNQAIYWVKSATQIPYYESSAPLRPILHWWMSYIGSQLLHAAAVGLPDKGVLLVGKGGSGKSNTAISCLDSDLLYAADDYCLMSFKPKVEVFSLYSTCKLFLEDVERYSFLNEKKLGQLNSGSEAEKALFFLHPAFKESLVKSFPLKAVLIPKVTHSNRPRITEISASKAYLALAPSTIFQMHGSKKRTHEHILKLLNEVPSFSFELSVEPRKNTTAILNLLMNLQ